MEADFPRSYYGYCDHTEKYGPKRLDGLGHYATQMMIQQRFQHHTPLSWIGYLCDVDMSALSVVNHRPLLFSPIVAKNKFVWNAKPPKWSLAQ